MSLSCLSVWQFHGTQDLWRAPVPAQQSLSALCPRQQQAIKEWQVWEPSCARTTFPSPRRSRAKGENVQGLCEDAALFPRGPTGTCSCVSSKPTHRALITFCKWAGHSSPGSCSPRSWDKPGPRLGSLPWVQCRGEPSQGTELLWAPLPSPATGHCLWAGSERFFSSSAWSSSLGNTGGSGWGHVRTDTLTVYPCYIFSKTYMNPNITEPHTLHFTQHKFLHSSWSCF